MPHSWPSIFVRTDLLVIPQLSKGLVCWGPTPKPGYIADTTSLMGSKLHSLLSLLKALHTHLLDLLVTTVESTITLEGETVFISLVFFPLLNFGTGIPQDLRNVPILSKRFSLFLLLLLFFKISCLSFLVVLKERVG